MFKKIFFNIFLAVIFFILTSLSANAQEVECANMIVDIIARNEEREVIRDLSFAVYEQTKDVDNNSKPGTKVDSGKIDVVLGKGVAEFEPKAEKYVLTFSYLSSDLATFYFYDAFDGICGAHIEITKILSSIKFTLRDSNGVLRKNTKFSVYTQGLDADSNPIREKSDLIASLNSGETGEVVIYVPDSSRSIDGKSVDRFVFESKNSNNGVYTKYDINVSDENTTNIRYVFSDMELEFKDASGIVFPADTQVEIFVEKEGSADEEKLDEKLKTLYTDGKGKVVFEYPERKYELKANEQWEVEDGVCEESSVFTLITRNYNSNFVPDLKYELYEQIENADGVPAAGKKVLSGTIDENGKAVKTLKPDSRKVYALKVYDQNSSVGDLWFFDEVKFICGQDKEITKKIPAINIVLRNGDGELVKNHKFSLYTQKYDADNNPIKEKEDLVSSSFTTSEEGIDTVYISPYQPYTQGKYGTYVFSSKGEMDGDFIEYGIQIASYGNIDFNYIFSDAIIKLRDPNNLPKAEVSLDVYDQGKDLRGGNALGKKIKSIKTDENGEVHFEYPEGKYAIVVQDGIKNDNIFWDTVIKNQQRIEKQITPNLTRVKVFNQNNKLETEKISISIYSMTEDENGLFYIGKKAGTIKPNNLGYSEISLRPDAYLFVVQYDKKDYGQALYTQNGIQQDLSIYLNKNYEISFNQKFKLTKPQISTTSTLGKRLKGRILLQVEEHGEAWYVDLKSNKRYYMKNGFTAYEMMRKFGLGITNANLEKIPVGLDDRFKEKDTDGDGVPDKMEEAVGSDPKKTDTDGDGYSDYTEIRNGYNPNGSGKKDFDQGLLEKMKGNILLQVQSRGEAWYVNPDDGKRYYMKDGDSAYEIMRFLSLGITNEDLEEIEEGEME